MPVSIRLLSLLIFILVWAISPYCAAAERSEVQKRIFNDIAQGRPLVAHVIVVLCDNRYQGIVKVPSALGNGQSPETNLYWGARFGVKTYFKRSRDWKLVASPQADQADILDRAVFRRSIKIKGEMLDIFVVAEAWNGKTMRSALNRFLSFSAGRHIEPFEIAKYGVLKAGGASHLIAFVGHNGLMDFSINTVPERAAGAQANSSIVLACASESYFSSLLSKTGAYPLLLTTGLMAPEAYTLEAVIVSWFSKASVASVHSAAANAYHKYQNCGLKAANGLFAVGGK